MTDHNFTYSTDAKWLKRVLKTMFKFMFTKMTKRFTELWEQFQTSIVLIQLNILFVISILFLKISMLSEICILGSNLFQNVFVK